MENSGNELYLPRQGHRIFCRQWLCKDPAKARANLLIAHGMGEHSGRYQRLAETLTDAGFKLDELEQMYLPGTPTIAGFNTWGEASLG